MACALTTGRKIPCKSAFGGIKEVLFADFGGLTGVTIDASTKQVTAIAGTASWYKFDVKGPSSLETTVTSSRDNGTTFYTQTINLTLTFLEAKTLCRFRCYNSRSWTNRTKLIKYNLYIGIKHS